MVKYCNIYEIFQGGSFRQTGAITVSQIFLNAYIFCFYCFKIFPYWSDHVYVSGVNVSKYNEILKIGIGAELKVYLSSCSLYCYIDESRHNIAN